MTRAAVLSLSLVLVFPTLATAQDLTGTWSYATQKSWKKGPCPMMSGESKGVLAIKVTEKKTFTLVFKTGRKCRPKSMCTFKGTVKGPKYVGKNSAKVDNEGGTATNTITLVAKSKKEAEGSSHSKYKHPGGMVCTWGSKVIKLTKK
jgi:hypothetical protein